MREGRENILRPPPGSVIIKKLLKETMRKRLAKSPWGFSFCLDKRKFLRDKGQQVCFAAREMLQQYRERYL